MSMTIRRGPVAGSFEVGLRRGWAKARMMNVAMARRRSRSHHGVWRGVWRGEIRLRRKGIAAKRTRAGAGGVRRSSHQMRGSARRKRRRAGVVKSLGVLI